MTKNMSAAQFEEYLTDSQISEGLRNGTIFLGAVKVIATKRKTAYVVCSTLSSDICIDEENRNRSLHGDFVAISLLPMVAWLPLPASSVIKICSNPIDKINTINKNIIDFKKQPKGKVVGIVKASHRIALIGTLTTFSPVASNQSFADRNAKFLPNDPCFPHLIIPRQQLPQNFIRDPNKESTRIYQCDVLDWPKTSRMCSGGNIKLIGDKGTINAETEALLLDQDLNHGPFPLDALKSLLSVLQATTAPDTTLPPLPPTASVAQNTQEGKRGQKQSGKNMNPQQLQQQNGSPDIVTSQLLDAVTAAWTVPEGEVARRRDLRSLRIFSIDPPSARDLDDTLSVQALPDGTYIVG